MVYEYPSAFSPHRELDTWEHLPVLQHIGSWYLVQTPAGQTGYVPSEQADAYGLNYDAKTLYTVTATQRSLPHYAAQLYTEPFLDSAMLGLYYTGTQVCSPESNYTKYGEHGEFQRIQIDGQEGYMLQDDITFIRDERFYYAG